MEAATVMAPIHPIPFGSITAEFIWVLIQALIVRLSAFEFRVNLFDTVPASMRAQKGTATQSKILHFIRWQASVFVIFRRTISGIKHNRLPPTVTEQKGKNQF